MPKLWEHTDQDGDRIQLYIGEPGKFWASIENRGQDVALVDISNGAAEQLVAALGEALSPRPVKS